jgi:protoporphyrinogen/coproporphyrinogen III oxidase
MATQPVNRVAIVGGGLSGLALAHAMKRRSTPDSPMEVAVFERDQRAGGPLRTDRVADFLYEHGPNGFLDSAMATMALVDDLGMTSRLQLSHDHARRRFIYRGGRLRPVPSGPLGLLTSGLLSVPGALRLAAEPLIRRPAVPADESIHAFAARRFGDEAAAVLADAMVAGVFGGDARQLSMRACFPALARMEAEHGSVVRALLAQRGTTGDRRRLPLGRLTSFKGGMGELVDALTSALGPNLHLSTGVERLRRVGGCHELTLSNGRTIVADAVVFAAGGAATARLLADTDATLAADLTAIPSAPMVTVCLGYRAGAIGCRLEGFGFLAPRSAGLRLLGVLWESSIFPDRAPAGHALLRVMVGGATDPDVVDLDDQRLVARVRTELRATMQVNGQPDLVRVIRHRPGIPQYVGGHAERVARIEAALERRPGLFVGGHAFRGVGINACIEDASSLADRVIGALARRAVA